MKGEEDYKAQGTIPAAGLYGCGTNDTFLMHTLPAGTISISWSTTPSAMVTVTATGWDQTSISFRGSGSSGSGSFQSVGILYTFGVMNCESQAARVSVTASYAVKGPIL